MNIEHIKLILICIILIIFFLGYIYIIVKGTHHDNNNPTSNVENINKTNNVKVKPVVKPEVKSEDKNKYQDNTDINHLKNHNFKTPQQSNKQPINVYNVQYRNPYYPTSLYPRFVPFYGIRHYRGFRRRPFRRDLNRRDRRRIRRSIRRSIRR